MVCRIKNRHTFKSLPILNSAYFTECRFVIRHITQTDTETETEANFTHTALNSVLLPELSRTRRLDHARTMFFETKTQPRLHGTLMK